MIVIDEMLRKCGFFVLIFKVSKVFFESCMKRSSGLASVFLVQSLYVNW